MSNKADLIFHPEYAVPPGETLKETLGSIGMTQAELAERAGRPLKTINEIIKGKTAITSETALQLERVLGVPASFWNNLESNYQERVARLREEGYLKKHEKWLERFPWSAMVKMGWLPPEASLIGKLRALLNFFGVAGVIEWQTLWESPQAAYRNSVAFQSNPAAVASWLRKGELLGQKVDCQNYHSRSFVSALQEIRPLTMERPAIFEPAMKKLCVEAGVALVFVPELPGTRLYGATRWLNPSKALIQLSLRGKSDDHFWFTFFHEAGHILLHGKREVYIETEGKGYRAIERISKEKEADLFAQDILIPKAAFRIFLEESDFTHDKILRFAGQVGIAPGIVVGRLQHENKISPGPGQGDRHLRQRHLPGF
jgi:HTH-type transcriptional regulator / antitoxin HigA